MPNASILQFVSATPQSWSRLELDRTSMLTGIVIGIGALTLMVSDVACTTPELQ